MQSCSHLEKVSITFVFDDTKYIWVLFSLSLTPIQSGIHFGYGWIFCYSDCGCGKSHSSSLSEDEVSAELP